MEGRNVKELAQEWFEAKGMKKHTCCLCGCEFYDYTGHNPWPVVEDAESVCCFTCNQLFVIPARLHLMKQQQK